MLHALGWYGPIFVDTVGHCAGAVLFGLLIVLLLNDRHFRHGSENRLSLIAAALVFVWNVTELVVLGSSLPHGIGYRVAGYVSFCCLSILPAVLLHISLSGRLRLIAMLGYSISLLSIAFQYPSEAPLRAEQSRVSLLLLTFGFALLSLGAWLYSEFLARTRGRHTLAAPNRVAFLSLFILATSYFHFQSGHTSDLWVGEAIWRHASIPIALLVLLADYRFFLLDVFLRFAASACWIALWVWAIYQLDVVVPLWGAAPSSEFHRGLAITVLCIGIYLLARSLQQVQRLLTHVAFRRPPLDRLLRAVQTVGGANEGEILRAAATEIAGYYKVRDWSIVLDADFAQWKDTGPVVLDPLRRRKDDPEWAILFLALRFFSRDGARLFLGTRAGGRRFLSEDLLDLQKISTALVERVERFRNDEIGQLVAQAELRALQAQINPHFLFNALNTLYGIIGRGSPEARQLVLNLAEVFRARLQTNRTYVPLREEIDLVRAYLEIEALRLAKRLTNEIQVPESVSGVSIPVLTIQPLIENAVRHGADAAGRVRVRLEIRACDEGLRIEVHDKGQGFSANSASAGTGTGLENVRRRLRLCYGAGYDLHVESSPAGALVWFVIPAHPILAPGLPVREDRKQDSGVKVPG